MILKIINSKHRLRVKYNRLNYHKVINPLNKKYSQIKFIDWVMQWTQKGECWHIILSCTQEKYYFKVYSPLRRHGLNLRQMKKKFENDRRN